MSDAHPDFATLATAADAPVEELALALAAELRETDRDGALARLDRLLDQRARVGGGGHR